MFTELHFIQASNQLLCFAFYFVGFSKILIIVYLN